MIFRFELIGRMPLIMHNDNIEGADEKARWIYDPKNAGMSKPGDDRSPPWGWSTCLYWMDDIVAIPNDNLMACIKYGGSRVRVDPKRPGSYEKLSQSGLMIQEVGTVLTVPEKPVTRRDIQKIHDLSFADQVRRVEALGFELYVKRVIVEKKRNIRVRPMFRHWRTTGLIQIIDTEAIKPATLKQILEAAGNEAGLMDRRPGVKWPKTPGPYGTFDVKLKAA